MAFQNEIAPNTAEDHQGRLAYIPDELNQRLTTQDLFEKVQEQSLVLALGETVPVGYGQTNIPVTVKRPEAGQVGVGTTNAEREGYTKPTTGVAWGVKSLAPIKLASIVTASMEVQKENPNQLFSKLQRDMVFAIARATDLAVFHGKNSLTGGNIQGVDASNFLINTPNKQTTTDGPTAIDDYVAAYELVDDEVDFSGWALDTRYRASMVRNGIQRDANGNPINPSAVNLNQSTTDLLGYPAYYGRAVGGNLGAYAGTNQVAVGGDWSYLRYGFADNISLSLSDQATVAGVSMWETNQIAIRVECTFGWILGDPDAFVSVTRAPAATPPAGG